VLFENSPVNYATGQPAIDHLRLALESGMHAITANKGPVVHAYRELSAIAAAQGLRFFFESTVMDGAPIFSLFRGALPAARLLSFRGILNSTTNLILNRMETGEAFEQAVAYAQSIGIAETDPSGDIDGWDAAIKVSALATVLMGRALKPEQVDRTGIRGITPQDITRARDEGMPLEAGMLRMAGWGWIKSARSSGDGECRLSYVWCERHNQYCPVRDRRAGIALRNRGGPRPAYHRLRPVSRFHQCSKEIIPSQNTNTLIHDLYLVAIPFVLLYCITCTKWTIQSKEVSAMEVIQSGIGELISRRIYTPFANGTGRNLKT